MKSSKYYQGSLTIEATIILPIVLIILCLLIAMSLMQYQRAYLQSLANGVVRQGATTYRDSVDNNIYWRIYDSGSGERQSSIYNSLVEGNKFSNDNMAMNVTIDKGIVNSYVVATINSGYAFGPYDLGDIHVEAKSKIKDTPEMIRTFQLMDDVGSYIPGYEDAKGKWQDGIDDVIGRMNSYFN